MSTKAEIATAIYHDGYFLMIRKHHESNEWIFPSTKITIKDKPSEILSREILRQFNLKVRSRWCLGVNFRTSVDNRSKQVIYLATIEDRLFTRSNTHMTKWFKDNYVYKKMGLKRATQKTSALTYQSRVENLTCNNRLPVERMAS